MDLTKEQEEAILTLQAENPNLSEKEILDAVLGSDESLVDKAWSGVKEYAPQALNALDTPAAITRAALLNPDAVEPLLKELSGSAGWNKYLKEGFADPEQLVAAQQAAKGSEGLATGALKYLQGGEDASGFRKGAANFAAGAVLDPFVIAGLLKAPVNAGAKMATKYGGGIFSKLGATKAGGIFKNLAGSKPVTAVKNVADASANFVSNPYQVVGAPAEYLNKRLYSMPFWKTNEKVTGRGMGSLLGEVKAPSDVAYKYGQLINSPEGFHKTLEKIGKIRKPLNAEARASGKLVDLAPIRRAGVDKLLNYYPDTTKAEFKTTMDIFEEIMARTPHEKVNLPRGSTSTNVPFEVADDSHNIIRDLLPSSVYSESSAMEPLRKQVLGEMDKAYLLEKNKVVGGKYGQLGKEMQAALGGKQKGNPRPIKVALPMPFNLLPDANNAGDALTIATGLYGRARRANPAFTDATIKEAIKKFLNDKEEK